MASSEPSSIVTRLPLFTRLSYFIRAWTIKTVFSVFLWRVTRGANAKAKSAKNPYTKTYPVRPYIENRVFIPSTYKAGDPLLPLYIQIHGGAFIAGGPPIDDTDNLYLCEKHGFCVVATSYRKAPSHPFPAAVQDLAALIRAILDDDDLPADKSKAAVGGYSAGATLSLSAVQLDNLCDQIKGVASFYPATNFNMTSEERLTLATPPPGKKDMLATALDLVRWSYTQIGQDKKDPVMSPHFADRKALPEKIYILGCEYDVLCVEAQRTAEKYAESESGEKIVHEVGEGWKKGNLTWRKVLGAEHGFNLIPKTFHGPGKGTPEERRIDAANDMHDEVANWLKSEVYV